MDVRDLYAEIGESWRQFVVWRERIFGGYLAVIAPLAIAFTQVGDADLQVILLLAAVTVSVAFWILDFRNRTLLWACQRAGEALEKTVETTKALPRGERGCYSALNDVRLFPGTRLTHGFAINIIIVAAIVAGSLAGMAFRLLASLDWHPRVATTIGAILFVTLVAALELLGDWARRKERQAQKATSR